jgi:hypothetical protein
MCKQHLILQVPIRKWSPKTDCYNTLKKLSHLSSTICFNINKDNLDHLCYGKSSKIPLICKICKYEWTPSIDKVINSGNGCPDCYGNVAYTLQRLLDKTRLLKIDERIDFSKVTDQYIDNGKSSKIPLICKICKYEWTPSIGSLIGGRGCPDCSGNVPYTLQRLLDKTILLKIDERIDFSKVTKEDINNDKSKIPLICKICKYEWTPSIGSVIGGRGCPDCSGNVPYTLQRLLDKTILLKIDERIDFSKVTKEDINKGVRSKIPLICKKCKYEWTPSINKVINSGNGCPDCSGNVPYTLQRLLDKTILLKIDERIDFSKVTKEDIDNGKSKIPLICKICKYEWTPSIGSVIGGRGCPDCSGNVPYTLQRLLDKTILLKIDERIDFSKVTKEDINNDKSKIPLICKICKYEWTPSIGSVIGGRGCPDCSGNVPYTLQRLLDKARLLNIDERIDFSKVTKEYINNGNKSKIPLICKKCKYEWTPAIKDVINAGNGCPNCYSSKGEKALEYSCKKMGISYDIQKQFESLIYKKKLRIDMYIPIQENTNLLNIKFPICVEYDGIHYKGGHFPMERHDEESKERHKEQVKKDKIKNDWCLKNRHHMIRIPYTSWRGSKNREDDMVCILENAFNELRNKDEVEIYYSDRSVYEYE